MLLKQYRPVIVIEYIRTAYRDKVSNVGITLDRNIKSTKDCSKFFDTISSQENKKIILEIKYDEYLPEHIKTIIKNIDNKKTAKSKFLTQSMKYIYP